MLRTLSDALARNAVDLLPNGEKIGPYLPAAAGLTITSMSTGDPLGPWAGFGLLCAYVLATIALAAVNLLWGMIARSRRDDD